MTSQTDKAFMDYQAQIIKELKEELSELKDEKGIEPPTKHNVYNKQSNNNLPYVYEITSANEDLITADEAMFLYVSNDQNRGLGTYGTKGYLKNDGPGTIEYKLGYTNKWCFPATLKPGESHSFSKDDGIYVDTMEIVADTNKTHFRAWWL